MTPRSGPGGAARKFATEMGVPTDAVTAKAGALDTGDEVGMFANSVGRRSFALVTSAYHMPRAMRLFRATGLNPVAAPCEHRAGEFPAWSTCLLPNADALLASQLAIHEYLGMIWEVLKRKRERSGGDNYRSLGAFKLADQIHFLLWRPGLEPEQKQPYTPNDHASAQNLSRRKPTAYQPQRGIGLPEEFDDKPESAVSDKE